MSGVQIVVSLLATIIIILTTTFGFIIKITQRWTKIEDKLDSLVADMDRLVKDKDNTHKAMLDQMNADRHATNERLTYLERSVWPRSNGGKQHG